MQTLSPLTIGYVLSNVVCAIQVVITSLIDVGVTVMLISLIHLSSSWYALSLVMIFTALSLIELYVVCNILTATNLS